MVIGLKIKKSDIWIDESHNNRIVIERENFEDALDKALYYGLMSKKAYRGLLSWFNEYKTKKMMDKKKI